MNTYQRIYQEVAKIPSGEISSYGRVAKAAGMFRGAQLVGWALKALPPDTNIPWQRVVNQRAVISIANPLFPQSLQKELLEKEGFEIIEQNGEYVVKLEKWFDFPEAS